MIPKHGRNKIPIMDQWSFCRQASLSIIYLLYLNTSMKKEKTINLNGTYYSAGKLIGTSNRAFLYGDSVFESIRFDGNILLWNLHYARLLRAAAALGYTFYPWWTEDFFRYEILKTVKENRVESARIRLILFRDEEGISYQPKSDSCSYLIDVIPMDEPAYSLQEKGVVLGLYEDDYKHNSPFSGFKSGQSMLYVMASRKGRTQAWDEVLIQNTEGRICESNTGNVWVVKDGNIMTPPLEEGGICGVMRDHLMHLLPQHDMEVVEVPLEKKILADADEIWISNAVRGLRWVDKFDGKTFGSEKAIQIQHLLQTEIQHD
ncbi:MAG: hypothetical protein GC180_04445 [Bacteroidetes bacterium]|nr:hypothetical protein [Bacteroidota bacterium]